MPLIKNKNFLLSILFTIIITIKAKNNTNSITKNKTIISENKTNITNKTVVKNITDALGRIQGSHILLNEPPYLVTQCDQVLHISGKILNTSDYSSKKESFMTLNILFTNFFTTKNASELIETLRTPDIINELTEIKGAPGCTKFITNKKEFSFCFNSKEIFSQIKFALEKFIKYCPNEKLKLEKDLEDCGILGNIDLTKKGPFGKIGLKIKKALEKVNKEKILKSDIGFMKFNRKKKLKRKKF